MRFHFFVLVTLLVVSVPFGGASEAPAEPVMVFSQDITTETYVAWRVLVPAHHTIHYDVYDVSPSPRSTTVAAWIGKANDSAALMYYEQTAGRAPYVEYAARLDGEFPLRGEGVYLEEARPEWTPGMSRLTLRPGVSNELLIVLLLAGEGDWRLKLELHASPGVEVRGTTTGEALFVRDKDFMSKHLISLEAPYGFAQAAVMEKGRLSVDSTSRLYGWFDYNGPWGSASLSYTDPEGTKHKGQRTYLMSGTSPGSYTFAIDHMRRACIDCPGPQAWLLVADVAHP